MNGLIRSGKVLIVADEVVNLGVDCGKGNRNVSDITHKLLVRQNARGYGIRNPLVGYIDKKLCKVFGEGWEDLPKISVCLGQNEGTKHQLKIATKGVLKDFIRKAWPYDAGQEDGSIYHHTQFSPAVQGRHRLHGKPLRESSQAPYGVALL